MIWADGRVAPPGVGGLHGVLALLPSAQITPVAHARLVQSFPSVLRDEGDPGGDVLDLSNDESLIGNPVA